MRLTESKIRQIIKEEAKRVLKEGRYAQPDPLAVVDGWDIYVDLNPIEVVSRGADVYKATCVREGDVESPVEVLLYWKRDESGRLDYMQEEAKVTVDGNELDPYDDQDAAMEYEEQAKKAAERVVRKHSRE